LIKKCSFKYRGYTALKYKQRNLWS